IEPVRPHEPARVDEAGELVAGEERLLERRVALHVQVLGMREHGLDHVLRIPLLTQDRSAVQRVLVERGVDLVVEVVAERRDTPELLVAAEARRVRGGRRLDRERVTEQRLAPRVARQRVPGLLAGRSHGAATIPAALSMTALREATTESFVIEGGRPLAGR